MTYRFARRPSREAQRPLLPAVLAAAATLVALTVVPTADASSRHTRVARKGEETAARPAGEPIMAIVALKHQRVTIYDANGAIMHAPVSSGMHGRETPAGVFSVIQKDKDHHSNLYDDAYMPNMLRITWSGIALHGGPLPRPMASHGCVRMPYGFAQQLFGKVKLGMRVIIAPDDVTPVDITHPLLFSPKPDAEAHAKALADAAQDAAKAADAARLASVTATRDAARTSADVRKLERLKARADAEFAAADKALAAATSADAKTSDDAKAKADAAQKAAAAKVADLQTQLDAANAAAQPKLDAVASARDAAAAAETKRTEAAKAARDAAIGPVSVFISRKTQKLYVRRGFQKLFDAPITIRDPDQRIGTHIFTAVARGDNGLRWTAVTIDHSDSAKDALDRVTIPPDVLDRIASTAGVHSSLIISDEALSSETGDGTEFVAVLHNQPLGGLAMRHHGSPPRYARRRAERQADNGYGGQRVAFPQYQQQYPQYQQYPQQRSWFGNSGSTW